MFWKLREGIIIGTNINNFHIILNSSKISFASLYSTFFVTLLNLLGQIQYLCNRDICCCCCHERVMYCGITTEDRNDSRHSFWFGCRTIRMYKHEMENIRSSHKFVPFFERLYMLRLFTYLSVSWKNVIPLSLYQLLSIFHYSVSIKVLLFFLKIWDVYTKVGTNLWDDLIRTYVFISIKSTHCILHLLNYNATTSLNVSYLLICWNTSSL